MPTDRAQKATPGGGSGVVTIPQIVAAKSASVDQPCGVIPAGIGTTNRTKRPKATQIASGRSFAPFHVGLSDPEEGVDSAAALDKLCIWRPAPFWHVLATDNKKPSAMLTLPLPQLVDPDGATRKL